MQAVLFGKLQMLKVAVKEVANVESCLVRAVFRVDHNFISGNGSVCFKVECSGQKFL